MYEYLKGAIRFASSVQLEHMQLTGKNTAVLL